MRLNTTDKIEELAYRAGLEPDFDPVGPTIVTTDERLIVWAPFHPYVGHLALKTAKHAIHSHVAQTEGKQGE